MCQKNKQTELELKKVSPYAKRPGSEGKASSDLSSEAADQSQTKTSDQTATTQTTATSTSVSTKPHHALGSSRLKERVLRDARVLPNNIVDVSKFMDSMVRVVVQTFTNRVLVFRVSFLRFSSV